MKLTLPIMYEKVIIDSGAFSAWNQNTSVNLDEYIKFCLDHLEDVDYFVNLDVIPGKGPGKPIKKKERENAAKKGWKNYRRMVEAGVPEEKLIHVFHQNEDFKWLVKMLREGLSYIGLSPANDRTTEQKMMWLNNCMSLVCNGNGFPIVKFHGFGVTSLRVMKKYPWASIDSTSWMAIARGGNIIVPVIEGKVDYDTAPDIICLSTRSPLRKDQGKHFGSLDKRKQNEIRRYIKEKGFTIGKSTFKKVPSSYTLTEGKERWNGKAADGQREIECLEEVGLSNYHLLRKEINIQYYHDLENHWESTGDLWPSRFTPKLRSIFGAPELPINHGIPLSPPSDKKERKRIYLAGFAPYETRVKAPSIRNRLFTFYDIQDNKFNARTSFNICTKIRRKEKG